MTRCSPRSEGSSLQRRRHVSEAGRLRHRGSRRGPMRGALRQLDTADVGPAARKLAVPYPWYFGGGGWGCPLRCRKHRDACQESGLGLCFDTSHAALECAKERREPARVRQGGRPLRCANLHHVGRGGQRRRGAADRATGAVNFRRAASVLLEPQPTVIPEIWMGHHEENGLAFRAALRTSHRDPLGPAWVLGRPSDRRTRPDSAPRSRSMDDATDLHGASRHRHQQGRAIAFVARTTRGTWWASSPDGDIRHAFVRGINLHGRREPWR